MKKWLPYAIMAAIFIAVRDLISRDIIYKYDYSDYIIIANMIIFIGTIIFILVTNKDINKIKPPNIRELMTIILRLFIVYMIVDPCIFNSLKYCDNPGYAKSIINLNTLFLLILTFIFYNIKIDYTKSFGVILLLIETYFIYQIYFQSNNKC